MFTNIPITLIALFSLELCIDIAIAGVLVTRSVETNILSSTETDVKACVINNQTYNYGDQIPGTGSCEQCICNISNIVCSSVECEIKIGCKIIQKLNQCCPHYKCDCEYNGQIYNNGEKVQTLDGPCKVCYCKGGDIMCTTVGCYEREDCNGTIIPGTCCPKYEHCPSLNHTLNSTTSQITKRDSQPWLLTTISDEYQENPTKVPIYISLNDSSDDREDNSVIIPGSLEAKADNETLNIISLSEENANDFLIDTLDGFSTEESFLESFLGNETNSSAPELTVDVSEYSTTNQYQYEIEISTTDELSSVDNSTTEIDWNITNIKFSYISENISSLEDISRIDLLRAINNSTKVMTQESGGIKFEKLIVNSVKSHSEIKNLVSLSTASVNTDPSTSSEFNENFSKNCSMNYDENIEKFQKLTMENYSSTITKSNSVISNETESDPVSSTLSMNEMDLFQITELAILSTHEPIAVSDTLTNTNIPENTENISDFTSNDELSELQENTSFSENFEGTSLLFSDNEYVDRENISTTSSVNKI